MPAPKKKPSQNASKHLLRSAAVERSGLTLGEMPAERAAMRGIAVMRRELERITAERHNGLVPIYQAAVIVSACRWERVARLATRWLAKDGKKPEADQLPLDKRLHFVERAATASDNRDKCLQRLGLDKDQSQGLLDGLYDVTPATPPSIAPPSTDAAESQPGAPSDE